MLFAPAAARAGSALEARLLPCRNTAATLHRARCRYGNGTENEVCNWFKNAANKNAWDWHMKCAPFCHWSKGSGAVDLTFSLNL